MPRQQPVHQVVDLTDPANNTLFNVSDQQARQRVASGDLDGVRRLRGHFALLGRSGHMVRMARSLAVPMRYFIAKQTDGPTLVVAHRIDRIAQWLQTQGLTDQFHPSYTRMVPAHYITEIALLGCPDPNPVYQRFFTPARGVLPADLDVIGQAYIAALADGIADWLARLPDDAPIGVSFSGGIDSGAVLLVTYDRMLQAGMNPARLKAFTLSVDGGGSDLDQARQFLESVDLQPFHEPIEVPASDIDYTEAVRIIEDYKPLDIQAGAMNLALLREIRRRYPDWKYLLDGDGGDENLKDYPIEQNPELTIRSVLNNLMLYHEGWGVDSIKHSLTYSGGLSRGCTRTHAPAVAHGFAAFSPFMLPDVIEVAEGIPFIELTDWDHQRLYRLKGQIVSRGVQAVTGLHLPVFEKRRFQEGAIEPSASAGRLPLSERPYRQAWSAVFDV